MGTYKSLIYSISGVKANHFAQRITTSHFLLCLDLGMSEIKLILICLNGKMLEYWNTKVWVTEIQVSRLIGRYRK